MTPSGWTRLWIVASVIWWAVGAFLMLQRFPVSDPAGARLNAVCGSPNEFMRICEPMLVAHQRTIQQAWWDLAPVITVWIAAPAVVWLGCRWIGAGFAPATRKKFGP